MFENDTSYKEQVRAESKGVSGKWPLQNFISELDRLKGRQASALMPSPAVRFLAEAPQQFGAHAAGAYAKLIVLTLISESAPRLARMALPESIRPLYAEKLQHISRSVAEVSNEAYLETGSDFERDLRMAAQLSVPIGGSRHIDRSAFLTHHFYRYLGAARDLECLRFLVRLRGFGPLFRVHIDERNLTNFDSDGWVQSYLRIAEMLRLYPRVKGVVGSSWTLDPQLDSVSPPLGYARQQLVSHGAFLREDGPGPEHTDRALRKSERRRHLYEEGKYLPSCYTYVWTRADALMWAEHAAKR